MERVASVLLEGLNLIRKSRRLFISYKQADTQGVAIQLYEALDQNGFDVFLDTLSIRPGEPFQDVLWHRLADTDVIILLDSPNFLASRWTTKELAAANSTSIQVLQLLWPENQLNANAAFSQTMPIEDTDFESPHIRIGPGARLKKVVVERTVVQTESLRARALAARYGLSIAPHVFLFQSHFFENKFPPEVREFENLILVDALADRRLVREVTGRGSFRLYAAVSLDLAAASW